MVILVKQFGAGGTKLWRKFMVYNPKKERFWRAMAEWSDMNTGIITKVYGVKK